MSECITGSYNDALYKLTYTELFCKQKGVGTCLIQALRLRAFSCFSLQFFMQVMPSYSGSEMQLLIFNLSV